MNTHTADPAPGPVEQLRRERRIRGYSPRTAKVYVSHLRSYLRSLDGPAEAATDEDIRRYLMKHRAILLLTYSAGLRVSEVVRLRVDDIESGRGLIRVRGGKARKDRVTTLSPAVLETLRLYWRAYRPSGWLFPGQRPDRHLTARSAQNVLTRAVEHARGRRVSMHTLRPSFAAYLLEDRTDLRYVQELLGHSRPETTMIYTHVTKKDLARIRSPLDNIVAQGWEAQSGPTATAAAKAASRKPRAGRVER